MSETIKTRKASAKPAAPKRPEVQEKCLCGIAKVGGINFRMGPGFDSDILWELQQGQRLQLKGIPKNGFIAAVLPDGSEGWVRAEFIEVSNGV